jgi:hypothetical protein
MTDISQLKVYSPGYQAREWGLSNIVDFDTAMAQPVKIAVLPVYYDRPSEFSYLPIYETIQIHSFDLVLFTDIEFRPQRELVDWVESKKISSWLLSVAGLQHNENLLDRVVFRPAWALNFLQWNEDKNEFPFDRNFLFDCLCGTRRAHRDYVMLALEKHGLLEKSIATYRDIFSGGDCTSTPNRVQNEFHDLKVKWPYVSPNLDPSWEVSGTIDKSISGIVPWEIYNRTYYSILVETLGTGSKFLAAEKVGKCLHGRRLFVHFGAAYFLQYLRSLGFETFDSILDERYDTMAKDDVRRWRMAFDQVLWLSKQNHQYILQKVKPILDHNHDRLQRLKFAKQQEIYRTIEHYIDEIKQWR